MLGKATTVVFVVTGVIVLYANYVGERILLVDMAIYISLAITIASSAQYVVRITKGD